MHIEFVQNLIDVLRGKKKSDVKYTNLRKDIKTDLKKIINNSDYKIICDINSNFIKLFQSVLPAMKIHSEVFPKYKSACKSQDIVVVASGPTLEYYGRIKDAVHIGVNHTFLKDDIDLDYLFVQDYLGDKQEDANKYRQGKCKKFYGHHCYDGCGLREIDADDAQAERYYFINQTPPTYYHCLSNPDITTRPLNTWDSIVFPAFELALWMHPKKVYLVGCDSAANGHYYHKDMDPDESFPVNNNVLYGWEMMQIYVKNHYPDIEIISINPVGLKGMFKDVYTENYLKDHPEIDKNSVEIIEF